MPSRTPAREATVTAPQAMAAAFHDAEATATALRRAVTAIYDVHGEASSREVLGPLLHELAAIADRRGIDVRALVDDALQSRSDALPTDHPQQPKRRRNARLFHALTRACIEMIELSRSEREADAMSEELFKLMLAAGLFEDMSATPRDPEQHLTAALPRDAVLSLMYLLASRRQHAVESFERYRQSELGSHALEELQHACERLQALGCEADVDTAMGLGAALWRPNEQQTHDGLRGLCFTFGRGLLSGQAADYVVRFDPAVSAAATRAADALYRAHLVQRRRPRDEYIDLHGVMFEQHLLHRGELAEAFWGTPIDPATLRTVAPRYATLSYADAATSRVQRARFIPVGEGDVPHAPSGRRTRH